MLEHQSNIGRKKIPQVEIEWKAVTYRSVKIASLVICGIVLVSLYAFNPRALTKIIGSGGARTAATSSETMAIPLGNQARFVNLDGPVAVKKVSAVNWQTADYQTVLEKGDLVRTESEAAARILFVDGTTYTIRADSLV